MRSPKCDSNRSRSSRLSFNIFFFATGDAQKDIGLEIEFMLDTAASCSIINYRTFWEISQFDHPLTVHRSKKLTKTYSGQVVLMIGYATIEFSYEPNGEYSSPLTVWITQMRTQNLLGWTSVRIRLPEFISTYLALSYNSLQKPSVMEVFTKIKHFLTFLEF